jgi:hypothetical protein
MATQPDDPPDVAAAVRSLMPRLRTMAVLALAVLMALAVVTAALALWWFRLFEAGDETYKVVALAVMFGIVGMIFTWMQARRAQEALVMPVVAGAIGLTFDKTAKDFRATLPARLLPQKAVIRAEDNVHGKLGAHRIDMAEVRVETGGKNSKILFRGLVARFPNSIVMPEFLLLPESKTKPGVLFGAWMPTDGLTHLRDIRSRSGETYGLWVSHPGKEEHPALPGVIEALTAMETGIGVPAQLFSAVSTGTEMFVALSHEGDLFRIGGLFPKEAGMLDYVSAATQELAVVLNLARALIAAEEAVAKPV